MPGSNQYFKTHQRNFSVVLMVIKQRLAADQGTKRKNISLKWVMDVILHPPTAWGSWRKTGQKDFRRQIQWLTTRKQCFQDKLQVWIPSSSEAWTRAVQPQHRKKNEWGKVGTKSHTYLKSYCQLIVDRRQKIFFLQRGSPQ